MRLGFLASHNGSNMQAIIDACRAGRLAASPVVVISNNADSGALQRARNEGIPCYHLSGRTHPDPEDLDREIVDVLLKHDVNLTLLAGYMKKVGPVTLATFPGHVLNIHPGLLPDYGGPGMYGRRVHEAVLAAGARTTGATVHVVDAIYDNGPVLAVRETAVQKSDTVETLARRVLALEHALYTETISRIICGEIRLS
ncbi:MAG: phosphoribosylglycinamide formyltransferase [Gammaproteobacteria bacterium]|nr:phosphoribosylglycinamide formyltransferase [Gammaproteobacteria bacterium]MCY4211133.1 phosphoribosylglycinamide formyltransferase [Gammaproteobacteria bacterium]MCY4283590.1 phosphoribosylglycinamide formyltransferase [Gammaproteobacteria bacterium]MCY4338315.1 phosphoribosylglycinamide formyltransferase [Gammaproteobacteria bacterium]